MPPQILDGESLAKQIYEDLGARVDALKARGITPGLGTILVGDDEPSARYVKMKHADCAKVGIAFEHTHLPASTKPSDIAKAVLDFNDSPAINAFIIQYPFPDGLDYNAALELMDPEKDADGLHPMNLGRLVVGEPAPLPCTPMGIMRLLAHYDIDTEGANVVIVGRGLTIGKPLAILLAQKKSSVESASANAAVTCVHTGVADIGSYTRRADILVAAAGSPNLITADMVKPGVTVIAAGVSFEGRKLRSDVSDDVDEIAGAITPRIGGVGPMTRAMLLSNTVQAAERIAKKNTGIKNGASDGASK